MESIKIKPLSINDAWQGRRYKTTAYNKYAEEVGLLLLKKTKPTIKSKQVRIYYVFHLSNMRADVDNFIKAFQDILFKWLGIDDSRIYRLTAEKVKCKKGEERIEWGITEYD